MGLGTNANVVLNRFGVEIRRYPAATELEADLTRLLQAKRIDLVLDVGEHWGEFGQRLRRHRYRGRIESFEPDPDSYARLKAACASDPLRNAHHLAISDAPGTVELYRSAHSQFASVLP